MAVCLVFWGVGVIYFTRNYNKIYLCFKLNQGKPAEGKFWVLTCLNIEDFFVSSPLQQGRRGGGGMYAGAESQIFNSQNVRLAYCPFPTSFLINSFNRKLPLVRPVRDLTE